MGSRTTRYQALMPTFGPQPTCLIVGVGAIGSHLAKMLAHSGLCSTLRIIDYDTVSEENLGPQCYLPSQVGTLKVAALKDELARINPSLTVDVSPLKFRPSDLLLNDRPFDYLFIAVDSMSVRHQIGTEAIKLFPHLIALIDARMGAEVVQLLTFDTPDYLSTIFPDAESVPLPCSARATPHCPAIAAGLMHHHFTKFLRKQPCPKAICLDLGTTFFEAVPLSMYAKEDTTPEQAPEPALA